MFFQTIDLALQRAERKGVADRNQDSFRGGRLDEEIGRAGLHGLNHRIDAPCGGDHDHGLTKAARPHLDQRFLTRHARHDQIKQHDVDAGVRAEALDRHVAAVGVDDREAFALENRLDQPTLRRIVIDDEDRFGHLKTPTELANASLDAGSCCHELVHHRRKGRVSET